MIDNANRSSVSTENNVVYQAMMLQVEYEINVEMSIHEDWVVNNRSLQTYSVVKFSLEEKKGYKDIISQCWIKFCCCCFFFKSNLHIDFVLFINIHLRFLSDIRSIKTDIPMSCEQFLFNEYRENYRFWSIDYNRAHIHRWGKTKQKKRNGKLFFSFFFIQIYSRFFNELFYCMSIIVYRHFISIVEIVLGWLLTMWMFANVHFSFVN